MKQTLLLLLVQLLLQPLCATEMVNLSKGWQFHLGDAGETAMQPRYDDTPWRTLNLPHDWSIEGNYHPTAHGTDWQSGYLPAGIGWYRKHFTLQPEWKGKHVEVQFDGVYLNSEVWINGHLLGKRPNGYLGFVYNLTPYLQEGENHLAVKVDQSKPLTGRWYTGSGIYRPVYLRVSNPTHIPYSGIYFRTHDITPQQATYTVQLSVADGGTTPLRVTTYLQTAQGERVGEAGTTYRPLPDSLCKLTGTVSNPRLWSPDSPHLYRLVCQLWQDEKLLDEQHEWVGIRSIGISPTAGFLLNGQSIKLKGVCDHHTAGAVGAAVPDDLLLYRLRLLKAMGCNAIRTAHNPFSPSFYTMCDSLGMLVMNEGLDGWDAPKAADDYGNHFTQWWERDMTDFIKRDRNHPSVVLWSLGNEVMKPTPEVQQKLLKLFHTLDPDRPVTQGGVDPTRGMQTDYAGEFGRLDIVGFNGNGEEVGEFERFRERFPQLPAIATEVPHTYQTRGVYRSLTQWRRRDFPAPWEKGGVNWEQFKHRVFPIPDLSKEGVEVFPEEAANRYYQSSYDNASVRISIRKSWQRTNSFPWLMGEFRWGSFDYLGEAAWPQRCGNFGIIDVAAIPKDAYYLYQSLWSDKPMVHILPHWTHTGKEGTLIPVVVYTNADEVDLQLNGQSLGRQPYVGEQLVWQVPFVSGKLEAIAYQGGAEVARTHYQTAAQPHAVAFTTNKTAVPANSSEVIRVELDVVDQQGIPCPYAAELLQFEIAGGLTLLGVDNGDPIDPIAYKVPRCRSFRGKCVVLLQPTDKAGKASLTVKGGTLQKQTLNLIIL